MDTTIFTSETGVKNPYQVAIENHREHVWDELVQGWAACDICGKLERGVIE